MTPIKNLLFDLGDVLLDLDFPAANRRFTELTGSDFSTHYYSGDKSLFRLFERGQISGAEFLSGFQEQCHIRLEQEQLLGAWNAILGRFPASRLELLAELGQRYRLFLLSNTNALHMEWFDRHLQEQHGLGLADFGARYFDKIYFSYEIGLCKPDPAVFDYVLQDAGIEAEETLFIDDNADNIRSAAALGLQVYHHHPATDIGVVMREHWLI